MSLEDIKARAEAAIEARLAIGEEDEEGNDSIRAAFVAEQSSYDVPKLIKALERILSETEQQPIAHERIFQIIKEATR